jgi:hypothetical protein
MAWGGVVSGEVMRVRVTGLVLRQTTGDVSAGVFRERERESSFFRQSLTAMALGRLGGSYAFAAMDYFLMTSVQSYVQIGRSFLFSSPQMSSFGGGPRMERIWPTVLELLGL